MKKTLPNNSDDQINLNCFITPSKYNLDDIAGQDSAINELVKIVNMFQYRELFDEWNIHPPRGILLVGPPGTGKTATIRALAYKLKDNVKVMEIRYQDIASRFMDAPIEALRDYFNLAESISKDKHVIIFIDEIDAMLPSRRDELHEVTARRVNVFLEWMDGGARSLENITIIGATNYIEKIDSAFLRPGRFDMKIHFQNLNGDSIINGLKIHLNRFNLSPKKVADISWLKIGAFLKDIELSGADVETIIKSVVESQATMHLHNVMNASKNKNNVKKIEARTLKNDKYLPPPISTETIIEKISSLVASRYSKISAKTLGNSMPIFS